MATTERPLLETNSKVQIGDEAVAARCTGATPTTTTTTTITTTTTSTAWQMEVLMERLRSKAGGFRPLVESAKGIKQAILNKTHLLDPGERAALGSCLDSLQNNIKVMSLSAMVERLEATAKQLGLKFTAGTSGSEVFVSCDMFYVEVLLDPDGRVRDVKVELAGDQNAREGQYLYNFQSSPELVDCLSRGDFTDFTAHLEGFSSIYQLNADKKSKSKAFQALQALETDLTKLFELAQETLTDPYNLVLKSPVGLLQCRRGGHAMRLVYFVSPYELLDVAAGRSVSLTTDTCDLSHYVTVNIDASTSHKLQTTMLMNIQQANGQRLPSFSGLTAENSMTLPGCFSLKLRSPLPLSLPLIQRITEVTGLECADLSNQQSLISLIIEQASDGRSECNSNRGLFVTLPDQQHCYFMTSAGELPGVMVSSVPFTHPTHITSILMWLRAQTAFNTLISSCVRPASKQDLDSAYMFEVTAASHEYISVTFEHPQEESTATAEIDLTDISNARCRLHTLTPDLGFCSEEYVTKVLQRCMSIPVTMRAVMRKVAKEERKETATGGESAVMMGGSKLNSDLNQNTKFMLNDYDKLSVRRDQLMSPHMTNLNNVVANTANNQGYYNGTFSGSNHASGSVDVNTNPLAALGNAVQEAGTPLGYGALLGAVSHKPSLNQSFLGDAKTAKVRKKKQGVDVDKKSPKFNEDVIDIDDRSSDSFGGDSAGGSVSGMMEKRRDVKFEKLQNFLNKRRSSSDSGSTDIGTSDLAALREQVYGTASVANYAKMNSYTHKDNKEAVKKVKKPRIDGSDSRKSPIVLDLTETEGPGKKVGSSSSSSHSSSLSAALLKRPGIEIIPIPGSNTPISIPSSITVTPVVKTEDKNKDKKDRRDKKDLDRRDKKRKREDSPSSNSSSSTSKASKVQIISSNIKHSSLSALEKFKSESGSKSGLSGLSVKPNTPPYQSPSKKSSLSPSISKSVLHNKVSVSPTHKPNKVIYSPSHGSGQSSSPKGRSSPKPSTGSPKHSNMSPKHPSLGKPSMTQLKSASPTFSKPSLSPKLSKNKEKERTSSSSPSRPVTSSSSTSSSSSNSSPSSGSKPKVSSSSSSSTSDKIKTSISDALTITKVSTGESSSSSSLATSFLANSQSQTSSSVLEDKSFSIDKAKVSPPKNRKGSSLSDIVDKLRAGVGGSSDAVTIIEKNDKDQKDSSKSGLGDKKDDKKTDYTSKPSNVGIKLTINKAKMKDGNASKSSSSSSSSSSSKSLISKSSSGLKPGVTSGPASKKTPSLSSLPPIPKLPRSSMSNVTTAAVSPLGAASLPGVHTSPLQYQRERNKDKDKDKDRSNSGDRNKSKESSPAKYLSSSNVSDKKLLSNKSSLAKQSNKDDHGQNQRKLEADNTEKVSKSMFHSESDGDKQEKSGANKAEADSTLNSILDNSTSGRNPDSSSDKGNSVLHNSLLGLNKLPTGGPALSGSHSVNSMGSSDVMRSRDMYQQQQYKSSKDVKDDGKVKTDMVPPPPPPRPPVTSSISSSSVSTLDHSTDHISTPVVSSTSSSSPSTAMSTRQPLMHPPLSKSVDKDHSNSSNLDHLEKLKSSDGVVSSNLPMSQPVSKPPTPNIGFPSSPSVSIKIVKSPAPVASPLNMISPHSVASQPSPCIIDDDLMDEALMGTRK